MSPFIFLNKHQRFDLNRCVFFAWNSSCVNVFSSNNLFIKNVHQQHKRGSDLAFSCFAPHIFSSVTVPFRLRSFQTKV